MSHPQLIATRGHALFGASLTDPSDPLCCGRVTLSDEIIAALTSGNSAGAVILGEPGIGKTYLLQHIAGQLAGTVCLIRLRGSSLGSKLPYGALNFLLAELEEGILDRPLHILEGLTGLLQGRAHGRDVVIAIDNADQLDEASILLIGQLVSSQVVRILAVCSEAAGPSHEFVAMCRANAMERFEVGPVTQDDTHLLLHRMLGHSISRQAVSTLFRHSGGNPRWLGMLCEDYVESRTLQLRESVWVVTDRPLAMRGSTREAIVEHLKHLTANQREIVDLLAVVGQAPSATLRHCCNSSDLDELQERGIVTVGSDRHLTVSLTSGLLAEAVRSGLPPNERMAMMRRLEAAEQSAGASRQSGAHWTCEPLTENPASARASLRVARAGAAAREGQYSNVLVLLREGAPDLDALHPELGALAGVFVKEALVMTGRPYDALALTGSTEAVMEAQHIHIAAQAAQSRANFLLAAGVWTTASHAKWKPAEHQGISSTQSELADGLLLALDGDAQQALAILTPALRQCEAGNLAELEALASAAVSFCNAVLGRGEQPMLSLKPVAAEQTGGSWLIRRLTTHFSVMAAAHTGFKDCGAQELLAISKQDSAMGVSAFELLSLCSALRLGERRAIEPLLSTSARCQGPFARLCELYAKAMDNKDLQLMLQVVEVAREYGHRSFARDAADAALELAAGSGQRSSIRRARRRIDATLAEPAESHFGESVLSSMTTREAEVVRLIVEGKSNKRIARQLDVSVRTVEGHLYQVYSKLHVHNREELSALLAVNQNQNQSK